jgi:hypothetical protein
VEGFREFFTLFNSSLLSEQPPLRPPINAKVIPVAELRATLDPAVEVAEVQQMINAHNLAAGPYGRLQIKGPVVSEENLLRIEEELPGQHEWESLFPNKNNKQHHQQGEENQSAHHTQDKGRDSDRSHDREIIIRDVPVPPDSDYQLHYQQSQHQIRTKPNTNLALTTATVTDEVPTAAA